LEFFCHYRWLFFANIGFREFHRIFGMFLIPPGDELITRLANVLAIENSAAEGAWSFQSVDQGSIRTVLDDLDAVSLKPIPPGNI
jgi:hypothetical protein